MTRSQARVSIGRFLLVFIVLCGLSITKTTVASITLLQANGETLTLPGPARRIITLAPNLAELVFAAGAGEHLEAVVEYSNFPAQVAQKQGLAMRSESIWSA